MEKQDLTIIEKTLENQNKRTNFLIKVLVAIIFILLLINGYFAYIFTTTTAVETTEQDGVYNFKDSQGNMVSSDLSLEEMQELIDINGKYKNN